MQHIIYKEFAHFQKFIFIQKWQTQKMSGIGTTLTYFITIKDFVQKFFRIKKKLNKNTCNLCLK
jgi:hypothetical protein